jgi:hypothetical protein
VLLSVVAIAGLVFGQDAELTKAIADERAPRNLRA